jgi:transcription elongation factor Elf1
MVFECPDCKGESHTKGYCKFTDGVYIRTRYCKSCKKSFRTVEMSKDDYNGYIDLSNGIANLVRKHLLKAENEK